MTFTLYPAGDCLHCGEAINEEHMIELIAEKAWPLLGRQRTVVILVHTGSGHERCEGRDTSAERDPDSPIPSPTVGGKPNVDAAVNYMRNRLGL